MYITYKQEYTRRYPNLDNVMKKLKEEEGIRVTAYVTAHLNVLGDVFKNGSDEKFWITDNMGQTYIQDYGQFNVSRPRPIKRNDWSTLFPENRWLQPTYLSRTQIATASTRHGCFTRTCCGEI